MSKPTIIDVQPAVDLESLKTETHRALVALQDAERREQHAAEQAGRAKESAARRRLELGRALIEARKAWPARGPRAKGWGAFLEDLGIPERTARDYMALAGYVEISAKDDDLAEIPTHREVREARTRTVPTEPPPVDAEPVTQIEEDAAVQPTNKRGKPWMVDLEEQLMAIDRHVRAAFGAMEVVESICEEHAAALSSPRLLTLRSMLTAVKTGAANALQLMEGTK